MAAFTLIHIRNDIVLDMFFPFQINIVNSCCFTGNIKVETPEEFKAYDPVLFELISRVFTTHRIPMDVFHGRQIRQVNCAWTSGR